MVWTKQRMTIAGQIMRIQAWTPSFKPDEETPLVPIWISLPELPWHCYNKEFITSLLSPIGRVLYLDSASINKTRGSQARVKVQVDLTKDRQFYINRCKLRKSKKIPSTNYAPFSFIVRVVTC